MKSLLSAFVLCSLVSVSGLASADTDMFLYTFDKGNNVAVEEFSSYAIGFFSDEVEKLAPYIDSIKGHAEISNVNDMFPSFLLEGDDEAGGDFYADDDDSYFESVSFFLAPANNLTESSFSEDMLSFLSNASDLKLGVEYYSDYDYDDDYNLTGGL